MPPLSVAIITLNEEANLLRTLRSLPSHAEVVVVDAGSTDGTLEIARDFGAKVFEQAWMGFASQKNFAIAQCSGDWVLSLDADEELSPAAMHAIISLTCMQYHESEPVAYTLPRQNMFLGRWIKHGGFYPDAKLRLFRKGAAEFEPRAVHETMRCEGRIDSIREPLIHHAYPTLDGYIEHMNRYSSLGADVLRQRGKDGAGFAEFLFRVLIAPVTTFVWNYGVRFGFRDGREGLLLHLYHSVYASWKYAKAWEQARRIKAAGR